MSRDIVVPDGLCGDRKDHAPHLHRSETLGWFWCTADQEQRLPYAAEHRRQMGSERGGRRVTPGGCPCGFWSVSNCLYVQASRVCTAPREERPPSSGRAPTQASDQEKS